MMESACLDRSVGSPGITGVLTSCGRHDLLIETLHSFYRFNTLPLDKLIIVEDGEPIPSKIREACPKAPIEWIETGQRVGQIAAIDYAYSRVRSPYIFHLEDDWEFFRAGFMEQSLRILRAEPKCLQVRLRAWDDEPPLLPYAFDTDGIPWRRIAYGFHGCWHGFSFNPGLRRLRDYRAIGGYGCHGRFDFKTPMRTEKNIGSLYRRRDYFAVVLTDEGGVGYVRHIGGQRHIGGNGDVRVRAPIYSPRRILGRIVKYGKGALVR